MIKKYTQEERLGMALSLLSAKNDEKMAVLILKLIITFGDAEKMLSVSKIDSFKSELNLGNGRADIVLFHCDGGISIIEVKADNDIRTIASGIGQLFLYESMIPFAFKGKKDKPKYISKIIAAPIDFDKCDKINSACELAGIKLVNLPTYKQLQSILKRYRDGA